jgi:hypothetical protein
MQMQQIIKILARMDAKMNTFQDSQVKVDINTTEMKEIYANMKTNQGQILAKIEANGEAIQEQMMPI